MSLTMEKKTYSVNEVAELIDVGKATIYRWIRRKVVPQLIEEVIAGVCVTYWTDKEVAQVKAYWTAHYCGKGIDRRTGKKAKGAK